METGRMVNPATGEVGAYEEVWEAQDVGETGVCVVLRTVEEKGEEVRGVAVRVAGWCQGVMKDNAGGLWVERWRWEEGKGWVLVLRVGEEGVLGCTAAMGVKTDGAGIRVGEVVTTKGLGWKVEEVTTW